MIKRHASFFCSKIFLFLLFTILQNSFLCSDDPQIKTEKEAVSVPTKEAPKAPEKVEVKPKTHDYEISKRLDDILNATGWFDAPKAEVKDGVVFLEGTTRTEELKNWAGELARNTQDTVAIVNNIKVTKPSIWEFQPLVNGLRDQWISLLRIIPSILFGLLIFFITFFISRLGSYLVLYFIKPKLPNPLIQKFIATSAGMVVMLLGLYLIFNLMGLTNVAMTVIGGTGLIGIIFGLAFKEITENFLASLFLSFNNPFQTGDLIEVAGMVGYVEKLTFRTTILIKLNGTYVQIPNATVYKSNILNFTSNPNYREDFVISIGIKNSVSVAQDIILKVLKEHPAVLKNPEPWVLVDSLDKSLVNLKIYFWIDRTKHSWLKVKSALIRLIKEAFQLDSITFQNEDRERIFPDGINVRLNQSRIPKLKEKVTQPTKKKTPKSKLATPAEGQLETDEQEIKEQALQSSTPEEGRNLLQK